jgi:hypothetical protein
VGGIFARVVPSGVLADSVGALRRSQSDGLRGTLTSFWADPATGKRPQPTTVYLVVQQTASLVTVKLLTDESKSASALARMSAVDGSFLLTYLYLNKPDMRVEDRSHMHHGSAVARQ